MISITAISVVQFKAVCLEPLAVLMLEYVYFDLSVFGYVFGGKGKVSSLKDFVSCLDAGDCNGVDTNFMNRIASDIGSGLLYLHERGIAQRDLKIANVLVSNHH
ncbi:unnamed protein product [Porites lobata]|nr:unnamed protein product [Porites lobata]